jgi:uncharacterized protein HemX
MEAVEKSLSLAERIGDLSAGAALFLIALALGYVVYRFILKEHQRHIAALDLLADKIEAIGARRDLDAAVFDASTAALARNADRAFDLADRSREETLKILNEMNGKLDRLLAAAKPPHTRKNG